MTDALIETRFRAAEIDAPVVKDSEMVSHLIGYAESLLNTAGAIHPMIVGIKPNGNQLAFCLHDVHQDKEIALEGTRHILRQWGATKYATLMESWYLAADKGEMPTVMPSQSERRKEAVVAAVCDKTGVVAFEMRDIERNQDGDAALSGATMGGKGVRFSGAFTELLQGDYESEGASFARVKSDG